MRFAALVVAVLVLSGCRVHDSAPWPPTAAMCWGNSLQSGEEIPNVRHFEYQMTSVSEDFYSNLPKNLTVGLYVPSDAVHLWMSGAENGTWAHDWYWSGLHYLAKTTDGDTWSPWPRAFMVDITNPEARSAMVASVVAHMPAGADDRTSLMLDYMTVPIVSWADEDGSLDLDRDGVPHEDDLDEQELLAGSYKALLGAYRDALPNIKLTANGQLALRDSEATALLDGVYVEGSGAYWPWWGRYRGVWAMLHPENPGNWTNVARHLVVGGTSVLECKDEGSYRYSVALAMMLTTDDHPVVAVAHEGVRPRPVDALDKWWEIGRPVDDMKMTQPGLYVRAFENGIGELRITNNGKYPRPFEFKLRTMDGVELARF